jgi:hypothetical protein
VWFKKRPSEEQFELVILQAATLARANEHDQGRPSTTEEVAACLEMAAKQVNVTPDKKQRSMALAARSPCSKTTHF